jgi:5'-deoxy-5'-methylthioadenosine phosphorylase
MQPAIGVIGGSGIYQIDSLTNATEHHIQTPFGPPSDIIIGGQIGGRQVYFLPRHARGHRILPHELPHRANIWALRSLGVRWIICVTAVGSLQERYRPRHIVLPDQFFDRTSQIHTFFGAGIAAHVSFADPISPKLRHLLYEVASELDMPVHDGGTYVNMDGPQFSTRAESETNRRLGFDIIGMTNLAEAKLAREAEIALADDGHGDGLRLLEDGRSSRDQRRSHGAPPCQCGNGKIPSRAGHSPDPHRARLAGTSRLGHGICHRPGALARGRTRKVASDPFTASLATRRP